MPKLHSLGHYQITISDAIALDSGRSYWATIYYEAEHYYHWDGDAETPAQALCLAIEKLIDGGE